MHGIRRRWRSTSKNKTVLIKTGSKFFKEEPLSLIGMFGFNLWFIGSLFLLVIAFRRE
jgi:hypothetical protein